MVEQLEIDEGAAEVEVNLGRGGSPDRLGSCPAHMHRTCIVTVHTDTDAVIRAGGGPI